MLKIEKSAILQEWTNVYNSKSDYQEWKEKGSGEIVLSTDNLPWAEKSLYFEMVIDG